MSEYYIEPPIETDPDALATLAFDHIQDAIPGWVPNDGNLETILIEAHALMAAEVRDIASAVPTAIFRRMGVLVGLEPQEATSASVLTTWTVVDNLGYTIPAGTFAGIRTAGDVLVAFAVDQDYIISPGTTSRADIRVVAVEPGGDGSGLGAASAPLELITSLTYVTGVTQNSMTTGGSAAETDDEYFDRLTQRLRLLAPRPILPQDYAILAQDHPSVSRALGLDGYNPSDGTYNNERYVAVAVTDADGEPLSGPAKAEVDAMLEAEREVNFVVNVIDATYTTIDINASLKARTGYNFADLEARVEETLASALSPATWGYVPAQADLGDPITWEQTSTVRINEIITLVSNVDGVDYVTALTMRTGAGSFAAADIPITGAAPLTRPGVMTVTVT